MSYSSCPTCGYFIAQKAYYYDEEKEKICSNPNTNNEEKEEKIHQLIKSLNLRYCCNMRIMTCKNIVEFILPVNE